MNSKEEIVESGIVTKILDDGNVEIAVIENDNCEECSAKIICKPSEDNIKSVTAIDTFGVKAGDEVRFSILGQTLSVVSLLLYGIPLLILILGILIGVNTFADTSSPELFSFLTTASIITVYYMCLYFLVLPKRKKEVMPRIISVKQI